MRRSGSSSCLLKPKSSSNLLVEEQLSVTMINTHMLPKYSTERFYMLSEIEEHAQTTKFLSEFDSHNDNDHDNITQETVESSESYNFHENSKEDEVASRRNMDDKTTVDGTDDEKITTSVDTNQQQEQQLPQDLHEFPQYILLYFLWRPETYPSARLFTKDVVEEAVDKIDRLGNCEEAQANGIINEHNSPSISNDSSTTNVATSDGRGSSPGAVIDPAEKVNKYHYDDDKNKTKKKQHRVYIVVDIVVPSKIQCQVNDSDEDDEDPMEIRQRQHQVNVQTAELLGRHVATSSKLRNRIDGITVGLSDHKRAAPGLEACLSKAILHGSRDRRLHSVASSAPDTRKSLIGIVTLDPDDLLGIDLNDGETDAVQGVFQSKTVAEWNGNGDISVFAERSHKYWKEINNVSEGAGTTIASSPSSSKRGGRRSSRKKRQQEHQKINVTNKAADDLSSLMIWIFFIGIIAVLWKAYSENIKGFIEAFI